MANNFLNLFETKAEQDKNYITEEGHNEFPWVSLCKENNKFYYTSYIEFKDKGEVGDFYYDNGKFSTDVDINIATPIGIVVIPENFIPSSPKCRIMSLVNMDCTNPENGSTNDAKMCWGNYGVTIPELKELTDAPIGSGSTVCLSTAGIYNTVLIPSDDFNGIKYSGDTKARYGYDDFPQFSGNLSISPYLCDENGNETFNNEFIRTEAPSNESNRFSDLDGYFNTNVLVKDNYTSGQTSWMTDDVILSNSGPGFSAAACCCKRFKAGNLDWYLPSQGEATFMIPRKRIINIQLNKIIMQNSKLAKTIQGSFLTSSKNRATISNGNVQLSDGHSNWRERFRTEQVRAFAII